MSEDAPGDKPYEATEQKLRQAREKGDIPRSTEASTLLAYIGAALALLGVAPLLLPGWLTRIRAFADDIAAPEGAVFDAVSDIAGYAALSTLAMVTVPAAIILVGLIAQRGLTFTPSRLAPDLKRIDPFRNGVQKFGPRGLVTFSISLTKLVFTLIGGWFLFRHLLGRLADSGYMRDMQWLGALPALLRDALGLAIVVTAAIAAVDVFWKIFDHRRRLRMSRREIEDEHKNSEGDPQFKALRRQRAVDIAMGSMLADIARADVVIVNPTHYAVALEWKRGSGRAPVCLAKGTDEVARRIRERAGECAVPIWSDPPCARALHATVNLGDEIPTEQFAAVAAAIRFAETMRRKARAGW